MSTVPIDGLADAIMTELNSYTKEITAGQKKAVDIVANEVDQTIRDHITFHQHSGEYVKSFRLSKTYEDVFGKKKTWFVKAPNYRLTHLLENGHALPQGGRSKAYPHIKYGQKIAERRMMELSEGAIRNAGN